MAQLFDITPIRSPARRGETTRRRGRWSGPWPPADRPQPDPAAIAVQIIVVAARARARIRDLARAGEVPADVFELLLLLAGSNDAMPIMEIADRLGIDKGTASRMATRAEAAGLVDKLPHALDERRVECRLSVKGRVAAEACLAALRPHASSLLGPVTEDDAAAATRLLRASRHFVPRFYELGWRATLRIRPDERE